MEQPYCTRSSCSSLLGAFMLGEKNCHRFYTNNYLNQSYKIIFVEMLTKNIKGLIFKRFE